MHGASVLSHGLLMAVLLWRGLPDGPWWLALPLLLPVAGIVRGRDYTYAWASMLLAFYAAGYLSDGYARPEHRRAAFGIASVAAIEFVSLVMYVRFRARERQGQAVAAQKAG